MKYYRVTGGISHTKPCECPNCDGHNVTTTIDRVVESSDGKRTYVDTYVLIELGLPADSNWEYGPRIEDVTLATIEAQALADWNAQRPTASPNALAMARGEL